MGGRRPTGRLDNVDPWSGKHGRKPRKQSGQTAARSEISATSVAGEINGENCPRVIEMHVSGN